MTRDERRGADGPRKSAAGAEGIFYANVVQRKFRDRRAANVHVAVNWALAGTTYGRVSLGLDPITPLI